MMKYVYVLYVKWNPKSLNNELVPKWLAAHEKLCEENGVKLLWSGIPYTVVEESAFFYETDMALHDFHLFKNQKIFQLEGGGHIEYGNTHMFLSWPYLSQ